MSLHNNILTYMIENLGLPLMEAVGQVQKKTATPENDAEMMAKLLTSSVELGIAISSKMNIPSDSAQAEALRFRLTALAANALSERVKLKSKEPTSADVDSLKATTDSLFVFSNNFSVNDEGLEYLKKIGMQDFVGKEFSELATIEALLPVVTVMEHKDRGLFPNIAERLIKEADELAKQFKADANKPEEVVVFIKQKILTLLVQTFVQIYPDIIGASKPIGDVWQEFDRRKALIILLMDYLLTGQKNIETASDAEGAAAPEAQAPQTEPPAAAPAPSEPPPVSEQPATPPPPPPPQESAGMPEKKEEAKEGEGGEGSGSPLGFFKK